MPNPEFNIELTLQNHQLQQLCPADLHFDQIYWLKYVERTARGKPLCISPSIGGMNCLILARSSPGFGVKVIFSPAMGFVSVVKDLDIRL